MPIALSPTEAQHARVEAQVRTRWRTGIAARFVDKPPQQGGRLRVQAGAAGPRGVGRIVCAGHVDHQRTGRRARLRGGWPDGDQAGRRDGHRRGRGTEERLHAPDRRRRPRGSARRRAHHAPVPAVGTEAARVPGHSHRGQHHSRRDHRRQRSVLRGLPHRLPVAVLRARHPAHTRCRRHPAATTPSTRPPARPGQPPCPHRTVPGARSTSPPRRMAHATSAKPVQLRSGHRSNVPINAGRTGTGRGGNGFGLTVTEHRQAVWLDQPRGIIHRSDHS